MDANRERYQETVVLRFAGYVKELSPAVQSSMRASTRWAPRRKLFAH